MSDDVERGEKSANAPTSQLNDEPSPRVLDIPWGWQLILDCFGCSEAVCCDLEKGYEFLDSLCVHLGMKKQSQPYVFKTCETTYPGRPGLSGWVAIIDSGIQIHTSANNHFVSVDVYSCKPYDRNAVESFVKEWCQPQFVETVLIERGREIKSRACMTRVSTPSHGNGS